MTWRRNQFGKGGSRLYVPGQEEPDEYVRWLAKPIGLSQQNKLGYIMIVAGFDDQEKISNVLKRIKETGLQSHSFEKGPDFKHRNPVIEFRYLLGVDQSAIVQDAVKLKDLGATDLSAIGVSMSVAFQLTTIFNRSCCPYIAVAPD
jgi:hypothetical protein